MKPRFDRRKLMELAIKVMRQSVFEPRKDGKASPHVGAVLFKPDGSIETASRGELRHGDHAEFTLLERKNRHNRLDGSILFATLEPCAPDSRHAPKMSCTERIILSRIKEVWVGIEDPDPKVDRKGIKALQDAGIKVHMFDRDLQEAIRAANKDFLRQAVVRAQTARNAKQLKEQALSPLENALPVSSVKDFSGVALALYRSQAKIAAKVGTQAFSRHLLQQGLLREEKGRLIPTGFGFLLFGKKPREILHQAGLLATIRYPDGKDELLDFDEPLILIPDLVEKWLGDKLPSVIDRSRMRRATRQALPFEMVREAVINALIHRDYDIRGAKCQLLVTEDAITIKSPGAPPPPITLEQLQSFNAPMLSRNPILHYVFSHMGLAEERGLGVKTLKTDAEKEGLPLPRYAWAAPYLNLTLYRSMGGAERMLDVGILASLSKAERTGWQWLSTRDSVTASEYAVAMGIPRRTAQHHLNRFKNLRLVRLEGSARSAKYQVLSP
jgi:ATP-dependent DNA helicase RecG